MSKIRDYVTNAENVIKANGHSMEVCNALYQASQLAIQENERDVAMRASFVAKWSIEEMVKAKTGKTIFEFDEYCKALNGTTDELDLWWQLTLLEARNMNFDSYMIYLEKNREPSERFYLPKRKQFIKIGVVKGFQDLIDDKLDVLSISLPPGTGKTTIEKFFHSAICGWYPDEFNLFFSHSADICRMYYDGVLAMLTDIEYTWKEIFPNLNVTSTNAKMMNINIGDYKPFQNLMCASVGSEMAGKVRASKFLLVDDMIGKIEEALNKNILDKLWNIYSTDARQRKIPGCKEVHLATRWSTLDVIGRLKIAYEGNDRARFIAVPDIDEKTGKSNFDYEYNGFSVEFFKDQEKLMDDITYRCLYKNEPIEREGLLYHEDELRRYLQMPEGEPDAILGVCDTKSKGVDYMFLPVMYQFGNDYYLEDCICNNGSDFGLQYSSISNIIFRHNMQQCEFESNAGGDRIAFEVDKRLKEVGGRCNITSKATETNKETRIIVNSDWVKRNILFKDSSLYDKKSEYGKMMDFILTYSVAGKNVHDDVVDGLANFALFVTRKQRVRETIIMKCPF